MMGSVLIPMVSKGGWLSLASVKGPVFYPRTSKEVGAGLKVAGYIN